MTKTSLINKPIIIIIMTITNVNFQKTLEKLFSRGSKPKMRIFDDIKISSENLSIKDESFKSSTEKEQNFGQNKIIPGFSQDNDSLFDDLSNNNQIIKNYKEFLNWLYIII